MVNSNIFLGSGASTVLVPEHDLSISNVTQDKDNTKKLHLIDFGLVYPLVTNLYIGCEFEIWNDTDTTLITTHTITSNTKNSITSTTAVAAFAVNKRHRIIIKGYGTPSPSTDSVGDGTGNQRLNADNWIGIAETITFPTLEQDLKQMNLGLGGTRNFSYQYKGLRTASGGSLALTASNGSWLYYALGEIDQIKYTAKAGSIAEAAATTTDISVIFDGTTTVALTTASDIHKIVMGMTLDFSGVLVDQTIVSIDYSASTFVISAVSATAATEATHTFTIPLANREIFVANTADEIYIIDADGSATSGAVTASSSELIESGPFIYRTVKGSTEILPPYNPILFDTPASFNAIDRTATNEITYRIIEANTSDLPSFSLEQSISKDPAVLTTNALYDAANVEASAQQESQSFTRIARGNRVNSLTLEAAEGEEVKFNVDLNSRLIDSITDLYNKAAIAPTYEARNGRAVNDDLFNWNAGTASGAPFFFSSGSLEIFGQQFLKISSISVEIANNLIDKRYMGGHRDMKEGIAAQRAYTISFTAIVTDDEIYRYFLNETETTTTANASLIKLRFDKEDNDEFIDLQFKNYFLDTANWTIPDDKGPVTVEATIKPRDLHFCEISTDWAILG
jgi:hypothetical protein